MSVVRMIRVEVVPARKDLGDQIRMCRIHSGVHDGNRDSRRTGGDGPCLWHHYLREVPLVSVLRVIRNNSGLTDEVRLRGEVLLLLILQGGQHIPEPLLVHVQNENIQRRNFSNHGRTLGRQILKHFGPLLILVRAHENPVLGRLSRHYQ